MNESIKTNEAPELTANEEIVSGWFDDLFTDLIKLIDEELSDEEANIKNEKIWELGYEGQEIPNPHTQNMVNINHYIDRLKMLRESIEDLKDSFV